MERKILIIGSVPPPVGGVTIHVKRLLEHLTLRGVAYDFFSLRRKSLLWLLPEILRHHIIHIHISSIPFCLFLSIFCLIFRKRLIMTRHGDIFRNTGIKFHMDLWSIKLAYQPIVLNSECLEIARRYNPETVLASAFLPELNKETLPEDVLNAIQEARSNNRKVFAVIASNLAFDAKGREIYGVSSLMELFARNPSFFLIAVVGVEAYREFLLRTGEIPSNVFPVTEPISFVALLEYIDGMIRNTVTDGDSVSVREGLSAGVPVFASDCVSRPSGTILYHSIQELENLLHQEHKITVEKKTDTLEELIRIYEKID